MKTMKKKLGGGRPPRKKGPKRGPLQECPVSSGPGESAEQKLAFSPNRRTMASRVGFLCRAGRSSSDTIPSWSRPSWNTSFDAPTSSGIEPKRMSRNRINIVAIQFRKESLFRGVSMSKKSSIHVISSWRHPWRGTPKRLPKDAWTHPPWDITREPVHWLSGQVR